MKASVIIKITNGHKAECYHQDHQCHEVDSYHQHRSIHGDAADVFEL